MQAFGKTRGRQFDYDFEIKNYPLQMKDPFQEDKNRIISSTSFRRLACKTQVISAPTNANIRTRLSHTHEVQALALLISDNLGLNNSLCEAIALGHDLGHAPYGHLGERFISERLGKSFRHEVAGVILAQREKGHGLNLCYETLEGILHHSRTGNGTLNPDDELPSEYAAVMFADKIAYTTADINDAIRYEYLSEKSLLDFILNLGKTQGERTSKLVKALLDESREMGKVSFSQSSVRESFDKTRTYLFSEVYDKIDHRLKIATLESAYSFFEKGSVVLGVSPELCLWLLTDQEANFIGDMSRESGKISLDGPRFKGYKRMLDFFRYEPVDLTHPGLDWTACTFEPKI